MKFFFDANLPPALARSLHVLTEAHWEGRHSVYHLTDKFDKSVSDIEFISALSGEGDWVVVTQDRYNKGLERQALAEGHIPVFLLDRSWSNHGFWEKATNLYRWWPAIVDQAERWTGSAILQVSWRFSGKGKFKQIPLQV